MLNLRDTSLPEVFGSFFNPTAPFTRNTMATVSLSNQIFYTPPVAAGPKLTSRSVLPRNGHPSAIISGAPSHPPPLQDAHDSRCGRPGDSLDDAFLISDGESDCDDPNDGRSDTTLPPLEELPTAARNGVQSRSVAGTYKDVNTTPSDSGSDDESVSAQQSHGLQGSPAPSSASPRALHAEHDQPGPTSGSKPDCAVISCQQGLGYPRHLKLSTTRYRRYRQPKEPRAEADNPFRPPQTLPGGSSDTGETEQLLNGRGLPWEGGCSADTNDDTDCLPSASSRGRESTLNSDEGDKPELASAEPTLQPPDGRGRIEFRSDVGAHCNINPEEDYGPAYPPVPDDKGEQDKDGPVVPPPAQEIRASIPRLLDNQSNNERRKRRRVSNTAVGTGGTASHPQTRFRRHHNADDGEDYHLNVHSDAEHSEDDDVVVRSPRRKRRKAADTAVTTSGKASQRQTRPYRGDSSSREARRLPRRPRRQRGAAHPPSSRESTLERATETDRATSATFDQWPLRNVVLKRVTMAGLPSTFVLEFDWDACAEHGAGNRGTEDRCAVSSAKRHRPVKQRCKGSTKDEDKPTSSSASSRARYTPADDAKIRRLKEQGLSWIAIAKHFPGRSAGAIEVRYHTKLKTADPSRSGSRELCDHSRALSPVVSDDGGEEEWEVEEICGDKRLDDGGLKLLVKWKGGEEAWEPYENVAETEALDEYERLHGRVSVDIV